MDSLFKCYVVSWMIISPNRVKDKLFPTRGTYTRCFLGTTSQQAFFFSFKLLDRLQFLGEAGGATPIFGDPIF